MLWVIRKGYPSRRILKGMFEGKKRKYNILLFTIFCTHLYAPTCQRKYTTNPIGGVLKAYISPVLFYDLVGEKYSC